MRSRFRSWPGWPRAPHSAVRAAPCARLGTHPRARVADRRGDRPAGQATRPTHPYRLRRSGRGPADRRPASRRRHRRRLSRPPDRPRPVRSRPPRRGRDHRSRRGRPYGRPGLPARRTAIARHHAVLGAADAVLSHPRPRRRRLGEPLPHQPGDAQRRLGALPGLRHDPSRAARQARLPGAGARRPRVGSRPHACLHPHQARRQGSHSSARRLRSSGHRAAREPVPVGAHPQPQLVLPGPGGDARGHRHRRPRDPCRRRRPGGARRPTGRAQGLPTPVRPHRTRRRLGNRCHVDDRRAGQRRTKPHSQGRHQAHDHPD